MPQGPGEMERNKDRACYRHQLVQVDLTVVEAKVCLGCDGTDIKTKDGSPPSKSYEVEIEILDVPSFLAEGEKELAGHENRFDQILLSCLDSARMLIRNV
jgi:polynucleotide 5'-triphosphatase